MTKLLNQDEFNDIVWSLEQEIRNREEYTARYPDGGYAQASVDKFKRLHKRFIGLRSQLACNKPFISKIKKNGKYVESGQTLSD